LSSFSSARLAAGCRHLFFVIEPPVPLNHAANMMRRATHVNKIRHENFYAAPARAGAATSAPELALWLYGRYRP